MMKKIGHSRGVYEVNLNVGVSVSGPNRPEDTKAKPNDVMAIPSATTNPRRADDTKFKFTKFPVRKQEAKNPATTSSTPDAVK